ncbi:hypothetical protein CF327_g2805 [Tilletia walkeri]|nr:hypothetical protein CF327_g2805 [Tilletia walkeri]
MPTSIVQRPQQLRKSGLGQGELAVGPPNQQSILDDPLTVLPRNVAKNATKHRVRPQPRSPTSAIDSNIGGRKHWQDGRQNRLTGSKHLMKDGSVCGLARVDVQDIRPAGIRLHLRGRGWVTGSIDQPSATLNAIISPPASKTGQRFGNFSKFGDKGAIVPKEP